MALQRIAGGFADLTEKEWQSHVVGLARTLGWNHQYHTYDSRRSTHGFPDLVLVRDRVIFLEVKRETGKLSDYQTMWMRALLDGCAEAYVARPSDLEDLARILQARIPTPASERLRHQTREEIA